MCIRDSAKAGVGGALLKRAPSYGMLRAALSGGPEGAAGQYGKRTSRVAKRSLDPKWGQRMELRLGGGALNEKGEYDNKEAPYTSLRLEVWDNDRLARDQFVGEVTVPLCPLMDGRTHKYSVPLCDPECKSNAPAGARGELQISIEYDS